MLARCTTYVLDGVEARRVVVECDVRPGLPSFSIVGLGDGAVRDLRETVRLGIFNSGYEFPQQRVTANIAPSSLRRLSPSVPLALALAVLAASGQIDAARVADMAVYGDLSISGEIRPTAGTLAAASAHRTSGGDSSFAYAGEPLPHDLTPSKSASVGQLAQIPSATFAQSPQVSVVSPQPARDAPDFSDVRGQDDAIFALTVAAAGGHHVLLRGSAGSGKTMLGRRLTSILPELNESEQREVATIRDAAGLEPDNGRPFRAPHYTISAAGLVGGGSPVRPGEVSLAHRGVMYVDELESFARAALDALRAPLEDQTITLVRGERAYRMPAAFQLVATSFPCSCGEAGTERCACDDETIARHQRRLSSPLLDRISIVIDLPANNRTHVATPGPSSSILRDRVLAARERRAFRDSSACASNTAAEDLAQATLSDRAQSALDDAYRSGSLSARGRARVLRVARTVADLAGDFAITDTSIEIALGLRGDLPTKTTFVA
jgi:magnesium chelatase family protein